MATPSETRQKRPLTADDLFALKLVSDPQPSPDGRRTAFVVTQLDQKLDDYRAALWLVPTASGDSTQLTAGTARDREPRWSPDGTTIAFLSNRPGEPPVEDATEDKAEAAKPAPSTAAKHENEPKKTTQIWLIRADGGEAIQLTRQPHGVSAFAWSPDGRTIAFVSPVADEVADGDKPVADERIITEIRYRFDGRGFIERRNHIWSIPVSGGEAKQLTSGDMDDAELAWSPDGRTIAFSSNRSAGRAQNDISAIYAVPATGGEVRCVTEGDVAFAAPSWSPDGTRLAFLGHREATGSGSHNPQLWTIAASGGEATDHTSQWDRACDDMGMSDVFVGADQRPVWAAGGKSIYILASEQGATTIYRVDLASGEMTAITPGPRRVSAVRRAGDSLVYTAGTGAQPFELFAADLDGGNERALTDLNRAWRDEVSLSEADEIRYTSPVDGQELQGWVLKPHDFKDGVRYPMIVEIHGGPHAMYGQAMFHEMQLMAARGYVVLFTNPRGSNGYGETFLRAAIANWGDADMPDVMAGVDAILARGYVDENRLGVTGGSYGGYLTNWVVGHTDRFRAAVTQRCVSNFASFYGTSDIGFDFGEEEFSGTPWHDREQLVKHSPITYVEQMTTPLLIIHSEQDLRCPIEQAEQLFVSLMRLGREVRFVRVPEESHDLSRTGKPSRRLARLHHLIGWFDQHL